MTEHDFPQEFVVFVQFLKNDRCTFLAGYPVIWHNYLHPVSIQAIVARDALSNEEAFVAHMLQLVST
jgi:hypothetical protein